MGKDDASDSVAERFAGDSLEKEFAALEITSLERMLRLNPGLSALLQLTIEWNESLQRRLVAHLPAGLPRRGLQLLWRISMALPYSAMNLLGLLARTLAGQDPGTPPPLTAAAELWGAELYLDLVVMAVKVDLRDPSSQRLVSGS